MGHAMPKKWLFIFSAIVLILASMPVLSAFGGDNDDKAINGCARLSDIEAIRTLRATYWRCIAEGRMLDLANLFSDDGYVDLGEGKNPAAQANGKEEIISLYTTMVGPSTPPGSSFPWGITAGIEITGKDSAQAFWWGISPRADKGTNTVSWVCFSYDEEYVQEQGEWKISSLKTKKLIVSSSPLLYLAESAE